jgi:hypothetical protein
VGAGAYAVVVAGDVVFLRARLHAAAFLAAALLLLSIPAITTTLYATIILLGESVRVPGAGKLSLVHVLAATVLVRLLVTHDSTALTRSAHRLGGNRALLGLLAWVAAFTVLGLARGNDLADVSETVLPFAYLLLSYLAVGTLGRPQLRTLHLAIAAVACLAVMKAAYISVSDVDALWDNAWQAGRTAMPGSPVARVILRGGDIFFVAQLLGVTALLLFGGLRTRASALAAGGVAVPLLVVANFLSMTRSNFAGIGAGLVVLLVLTRWPRRRVASSRTAASIVVALVVSVVLFVSLNRYYGLLETFSARTGATSGDAYATIDWRAEEAHSILAAIKGHAWLGAGAGSRYAFPNDPNDLGVAVYSHNGYLWMIHHFGVVGLALFLWLAAVLMRRTVRILRSVTDPSARALGAAAAAGWVAMMVLTLAVNKLSSISGGFLWGLLAATTDLLYEGTRTPALASGAAADPEHRSPR